jgi:hypothetical protein
MTHPGARRADTNALIGTIDAPPAADERVCGARGMKLWNLSLDPRMGWVAVA